ncbi:unnamed protein product [Paramecium sonneborni]|uniref:Uncharacterized protein n=1 Tax=Paramecium sonneborni TaxID=65129 RepID=A0A8S1RMR8_9CILI|nr:unnamed protein product [Paramecium sonneborni]
MAQNLNFCIYHPDQLITNICIAHHACIRKICEICLSEHQVQCELLPTLEEFQNLFIQKSNTFMENNISTLAKFRSNFEAFLQNTQNNFESIWKQLRESINTSLGNVEQLNETLLNYITYRNNPFESSGILNCLISIIQGDSFVELNSLQNSYYLQANNYQNQLDKKLSSFYESLKQEIETKLPKLYSIPLLLEVKKEKDIQNIINSYNIKIDQVKQIETYIQTNQDLNKIPILISKQNDLEQIYVLDGEIIKIEPLEQLAVENNDTSSDSQNIFHLDQIQYLQWIGQYEKRNKKIGRWQAFFRGKKLENVGGIYNKEGKKAGLWVEISSNFWQEAQVFEKGEYQNEKKQGQWSIIYENQQIGGGKYDGFEQKQGYWVELNELFCNTCQIFYKGKYANGKKTGKWVTTDKEKIIGGGYFDMTGQKIGLWIEFSKYFRSQVILKGTYYNGVQVGFWNTFLNNNSIGGGYFDDNGLKIGYWKELYGTLNQDLHTIFDGYYVKGSKQGLWEATMKSLRKTTHKIGGGCYNQNGLKDGRWIDLHDRFKDHCFLIYNGYYNEGLKVGNWDILYKYEITNNFIKMFFIPQFLEVKAPTTILGKKKVNGQMYVQNLIICFKLFIEVYICKVRKWENGVQSLKNLNKFLIKKCKKEVDNISGGGLYNEKGLKEGNWVSLHERFHCYNQIIYEGMYKNGVRNGIWQSSTLSIRQEFEKNGGGKYDQVGLKQGKWTDLEYKSMLDLIILQFQRLQQIQQIIHKWNHNIRQYLIKKQNKNIVQNHLIIYFIPIILIVFDSQFWHKLLCNINEIRIPRFTNLLTQYYNLFCLEGIVQKESSENKQFRIHK